tara:strand:- start:6731 stop:6988 length:258 start_codon:yes stop_codon:yes gene_type:complete
MSKMRDYANKNTMQVLQQIEGRGQSSVARPSADTGNATPEQPPEPFVSFSISKTVGDAQIHASGPMGTEAKARALVDEAVERLKK